MGYYDYIDGAYIALHRNAGRLDTDEEY